eukprot:1161577-Pelagomonas_calceolata.AAC.4
MDDAISDTFLAMQTHTICRAKLAATAAALAHSYSLTFNVAGRMIIATLSKSPWGGLVNTEIGSDDRLAQHCLNFVKSRLTSSRPDAILITPYITKPSPSSPPPPPPPPLPPPHTRCFAARTAPHTGPTQLPALDNPVN